MRKPSAVRRRLRYGPSKLIATSGMVLMVVLLFLFSSMLLFRTLSRENPVSVLKRRSDDERTTRNIDLLRLPVATLHKRLEFVHITKTAGYAIEEAAARAGIPWGICHFERRPQLGPGCRRPDMRKEPLPASSWFHGEPWHTPLGWPGCLTVNWADVAVFVVVRNPYDRLVSEYYCKYFGRHSTRPDAMLLERDGSDTKYGTGLRGFLKEVMVTDTGGRRRLVETAGISVVEDTPETLNVWIQQQLLYRYQPNTGHLLPQHHFVLNSRGERTADHVIRYELLEQEFPQLMDAYHLPILLSKRSNTASQGRSLSRNDLDERTLDLIHEIYQKDFDLFGYNRIGT